MPSLNRLAQCFFDSLKALRKRQAKGGQSDPRLYILSTCLEWLLAPRDWSRQLSHCRKCEVAVKSHVRADKHAVADCKSKAKTLIVRVAQSNREPEPAIWVSRSTTPNIFMPSFETAYSSSTTPMCRKPRVSIKASTIS